MKNWLWIFFLIVPEFVKAADFATRCAAAGVVKCVSFDTTADFPTCAGGTGGCFGSNMGLLPPSGTSDYTKAVRDTTMAASGASSLKFIVNTNTGSDAAGTWFTNFSADELTRFGANTTFYVQWRQRFNTAFATTTFLQTSGAPQGGIKQAIISAGDNGANNYSSCNAIEMVAETYYQSIPRFPTMYNSCVGCTSHGPFTHLYEKSGLEYYLQNAMPSPRCKYSNAGADGCATWFANEWMTFKVAIELGPRVQDEWTPVRTRMWVGREGQASVLALDFTNTTVAQPVNQNICAGPPASDLKFGKIWLLPYMTNKKADQVHSTAETWYDDLIISTQDIADPTTPVTRYIDSRCTVTNPMVTYNPTGGSGADAGSGSCTGGTATVYSSITNAFQAGTTQPGDTLYLRASTGTGSGSKHYAEQIRYETLVGPVGTAFTPDPDGVQPNAPTIAGYPGETISIQGVSLYGNNNWHHIVFKNLIFDRDSQGEEPPVLVGGNQSAETNPKAHHIRFVDCIAREGMTSGGVSWFAWGTGNNEWWRGRVHNNGETAGLDHGFYITSRGNLVDGVEIDHNAAYGVTMYINDVNNTIIRNNRVHDNATLGAQNAPSGIQMADCQSGCLIYNNEVWDNWQGIEIGGYGDTIGVKVFNNTVWSNTSHGFHNMAAGTLGTQFRNNIGWENGISNLVTDSAGAQSGTVISNHIIADPKFTNPVHTSAANFALLAGSPAIGAGVQLCSEFTTDIAGAPRDCSPPEIWDAGARKATVASSITLHVPDAVGLSWQIGSSQTVTWTSIGNSGSITINEDRDNNGSYESPIVANHTDTNGSYSFTVGGSACPGGTPCRKMQVCDADGTPCDVSTNAYLTTVAAGGSGTVIISDNTTGTHQGTWGGTTNALLAQSQPTTIHAGSQGVRANKFDSTSHAHTVLKFPTSVIPPTATITAAVLGLYRLTGTGSFSIDFRNVKRAWVQSEASWTNYLTTPTATPWGTAGGINNTTDRDSTVLCNMSVDADFEYHTCSSAGLTAWAQAIVNLSTPNNGLHLERFGAESSILGTFASNSDLDSAKRPYLSLTYTTIAPTISIVQPTALDSVFPGQSLSIRWGSQGVSGNVMLLLSRDGGVSYPEMIAASIPFDSPDHVWSLVTPGRSNNCKVKVISLNDTNVFGESAPFKIRGRRTRLTQ